MHQQVLNDGVRVSGCTAYFLKPRGPVIFPIILQETCRAYPEEDTATSLAERVVSECEWKLLPEAVSAVANASIAVQQADAFEYAVNIKRKATGLYSGNSWVN